MRASRVSMALEAGKSKPATHFVLYLNQHTFLGEEGQKLVNEVKRAMRAKLPLLLLHENDPNLGGCEFSTFFKSTPEQLIRKGIYKTIAVALHTEPHRKVSLSLAAKALGATHTTFVLHHVNDASISSLMKTITGEGASGRISISQGASEEGAADKDIKRGRMTRRIR